MEHLSPSSINMFLRCPAQFYFSYFLKIKIPPSGALTLGKSYDAGCQKQFVTRKDEEHDAKINDVVGAFEECFDAEREATEWREEEPAAAKDTGIACLVAYANDGLYDIEPTAVQEKLEVAFSDETLPHLLGFVDVVHADTIIVDQKTTGRAPSAVNGEHAVQLSLYVAMNTALKGKSYTGRIDYAVKNKAPKIVKLPHVIGDEEIQFQLRQYQRVARAIAAAEADTNLIVPNRNHPWVCSDRWCGWYALCHQTF